MKRKILTAILTFGIFIIFGAISANAQTDLTGKYTYKVKANYDKESESYQSLFEITVELKDKNRAVFTKTKSEIVEIEKPGSWNWDQAKKLVIATFPAAKNTDGEKYAKVIIIFKLDGQNLKVVKVLPASAGKIGDVFVKN